MKQIYVSETLSLSVWGGSKERGIIAQFQNGVLVTEDQALIDHLDTRVPECRRATAQEALLMAPALAGVPAAPVVEDVPSEKVIEQTEAIPVEDMTVRQLKKEVSLFASG